MGCCPWDIGQRDPAEAGKALAHAALGAFPPRPAHREHVWPSRLGERAHSAQLHLTPGWVPAMGVSPVQTDEPPSEVPELEISELNKHLS